MRVLVACELSGVIREAFRRRGHDAWSCDLEPAMDGSQFHLQGDALEASRGSYWELMIAHPPCTYLAASGLHRRNQDPTRDEKTEAALEFVRQLMDAPIWKIAIENPVGCISTRIRPASQYIQPWQFGHDASKRTGLWLQNLPPLVPTRIVAPTHGIHYSNQTPSGQSVLGQESGRARERAITYSGIATAMARQWG